MSSLGIFNKETKTYQKVVGAAILDKEMSDTSENPVQNKVIKKYVDDNQVEVPIAGTGKAGIVKPADGLTVAEDGTLKVKLDGTTLTMDQVNNVIKLADTLKDKIGSALQPESIVNNQITTEEGFALDARQANPNLDGTLAKQLSDLNGSLNNLVPVIDDCDLVTTHLAISNNALNSPHLSGVVSGAYALILTVWIPTPQPFNQQIAFVAGRDEIALRACGGDGKWSAWKKINVN